MKRVKAPNAKHAKRTPFVPNLDLYEQIGRRIRLTREGLGLRPLDWVARYKVGASQLSNWEAGRSPPNIQFIIRLCEDYQLSADWFYRGHNPPLRQRLHPTVWGPDAAADNSPRATVESGKG